MSAPIAGFVDHYNVLGVDPKSDTATIHAAYTALATRAKQDGDTEKYAAVTASFEVLGDPEGRKAFDAVRLGPGGEEISLRLDLEDFFECVNKDANRRLCLLCVLYNRRRQSPRVPGFPLRVLDKVIRTTPEETAVDIWFLKEKGYISADDKSALTITVAGIEFLEQEKPSQERVAPFLIQAEEAPVHRPAVAVKAPEEKAPASPLPPLPRITVPPRSGEPLKINIPKSLSRPKAPPAH
ncbi:MAG: DnaJ domain-containing protein [Bryobacteraceae bacterium]